jgi:DNA invertase Pin-like site-specific DNA recombinase
MIKLIKIIGLFVHHNIFSGEDNMIYAYIRVSTDKQNTENQRFEILKFADEKKFTIHKWVEETITTRKKLEQRKLGQIIKEISTNDILICSEISRFGRSLMEVMSILYLLMEMDVKVYTVKERYELGNNINSKILAFTFSLAAEIERQMISQRTKEALARKKVEGNKLGRPKGSLSEKTKLTGKEEIIREFLENKVSVCAIGRILKVNRMTVSTFIKTRRLRKKL